MKKGASRSQDNEARADPAATPFHAAIKLSGPHKPCLVRGHRKPPLGESEYRLIQRLLEIFPASLSRCEIEAIAGPEAHQLLISLRRKDTLWASVLQIPTRNGRGGYRIR